MRVQSRPHVLADLACQLNRGEEIHIVHVETHLPRLHRVVKLHLQSIGCRQLFKEGARVAAEMESGHAVRGFDVDFSGLGQAVRQ